MAKFKVSKYGQWEYPGENTIIPSGDITMQGVPYPVLGIDNLGNTKIMQPGGNYQFPGNMVYEIPMAYGGDISIPDLSRPNWLDKAQKGQQVKYYDDPLQFKKANRAYEDSLSLYNQYPAPSQMASRRSVPWQEIQNEFIRNRDPGYVNYFGAVLNDKLALDQKSKTKIAPVGIVPLTADTETSDTSYNYVYKKPTQKPVYKEKPKEYIPTKTVKLEREPVELVMPQSDRTLMPYNNTMQVLRGIQQDDRDKQGPKVIPAPDFRYGGWLDKYQDGRQVKSESYRTPWWNPEKPSEWNPAWTSDPIRQNAQADFPGTYVLPTVEVTGEKPQRFKDQEAATIVRQVLPDRTILSPSDDPQKTYDDFMDSFHNTRNAKYNDTLIDITDKPMGWFNFNTIPGEKYTDILGNNYIEVNRGGTGKPEDYAKNWKTRMQDPEDTFRNSDYAKEAGSYYHSKDIPAFYGIENNKFKVGKPGDFKDDTVIVPVRNSTTPYSKVEVDEGVLKDDLYTYDKEGNKIWNLRNKQKFLVHSPVTNKTIFISKDSKENKNSKESYAKTKKSLDDFSKNNPEAYIISLDEGRFRAYMNSPEGLDDESFKTWNAFSGTALQNYLAGIGKEAIDHGSFSAGTPLYSPVGNERYGYNLGILKQKYGGWLDKYQGDKQPSQVRRDPNQPFFKSETEPGTYEAQYSQPEVTITPNWTEEELKRNQLRDKYIADDKKAWRHWYDKLGYDKENVTKRANQFAYNKLAKQYLKGDKDQLTAEQRKFIEKSEYANRLQPSIPSRFLKGVKQLNPINSIMYPENMPSGVMELMSNLAAPLEYPTNLVRGAVMGEFTDALKGQTPSPYFVSSDLAGTSPTEAAIASGLMDFGVDAGIGALGEIGTLSKGIKGVKSLVGKATKPLYNKLRGIEEYTPDYPFSFLGEDARSLSKDEYFKLLNERNSDIGKFKVTDTDEGDIWSSPGTRELQKKAHDEGVDFAHRWVISDPEKHKALKEELSQLPIKQKENTDKINAAADKFIKWTEENNIQTKNGFYDISPSNPKYSDFVQKHREYTSELETFKEFLRSDTKSKILDEFEKTVDPDFKKKVEAIYNAAGKEMPKYSGIENFDKGRHKLIYPGELESAQSLSDYSNDYVAKHFNTIGGVRTKDDTITLGSKPRQDYSYTTYKPFKYGKKTYIPKPSETTPLLNIRFSNEMIQPETIRGIAAHETGHDAQDLYDHFTGNIVESSPRFGYLTNTKDNPIAKRFKEAMVDPKDLTEQDKLAGKYYNYDTWLGAYDELHSETMKARGNVVAKYMEDYKMPLEDAVAAVKNMEREGNFELFNYYLEQQNLNKHFKPTTPKQERISLLKDYVPALLTGLGTAAALRKEKDGGWLDTYQDYNYIKYKDLSLSKGTGWLDNYK